MGVGPLVAEVLVDSAGGNDGNDAEGSTSIGHAVALLGLRLNVVSEGDSRSRLVKDPFDCLGRVDSLGFITEIVDDRHGIVCDEILNTVSPFSLKILELFRI